MTYRTIRRALEEPIQADRLVSTVNHYTDRRFAFGILTHGTCFLPEPGVRFDEEAGRLMAEAFGDSLTFEVREMDDGNYAVRFSEHVFGVVFRDEFDKGRQAISQEAAAVSEEVIFGDPSTPEDHLLIGLYARTRLIEDMKHTLIIRVVQGSQGQ